MIIRFSCRNFRNLHLADPLEFSGINLLVGPNNSGKTNLISAMTFLIDLLSLGFEKTIRKRHYRSMLNRYVQTDLENDIEFDWIFNTDEGFADMEYCLSIDIPERNYIENTLIISEKLSYSEPRAGQKNPFSWISCHDRQSGQCSFPIKKRGRTSSLIVDASARESIFNQLDQLIKKQQFTSDVYPVFYPTAESVKRYLDLWRYYRVAEISSASLKSYSVLRGEELFINEKGDNMGNVLRVIFPKYPSFKLAFVKNAQEFIPELETIEYEIIGDREVNIFVLIKGQRFDWHELSDGTVRLLFLLFILTSPMKPGVLFIDEPELNLHPAWQKILAGYFMQASRGMQLFVSTHSPELLDGFSRFFQEDAAGLFVFDTTGNVKRLRGNSVLQEQFEEGWELGDLYRVADPLIGGWPW